MFGKILVEKGSYAGLRIALPTKTLVLDKVDFNQGNLVFVESDGKNRTHFRPLDPKKIPTMGVGKNGCIEYDQVEVISLAEAVRRSRAIVEKDLPIQLQGDWYLSTSGRWHGTFLTNGSHAVERLYNSMAIKQTRSKPRAVTLDPIGWTKSQGICFPVARVLELLDANDGILADPYAWSKRYLPKRWNREGEHQAILVIGPKS